MMKPVVRQPDDPERRNRWIAPAMKSPGTTAKNKPTTKALVRELAASTMAKSTKQSTTATSAATAIQKMTFII
jgi:hypothetical protein